MFKVKHLGVAAAMILVAAGAMASNFRAADQVYVPAAGHLAGGTGTFISDVWISNLSATDSVSVSVIYTPTGAGAAPQYFDNVIQLLPKERKEYVDFFPSALGVQSAFGTLIFNACKQGADCINTQDDYGNSPNYRNIVVFSRIYQIPTGTTLAGNPPTTGQAMPGIPWYNFVSSRAVDRNRNLDSPSGLARVFIQGLRNTGTATQAGTSRGNIGLMNASQYSSTTIVARLFSGAGTQIGGDYSVTLGPLNHTQPRIEQMFPAFTGVTATNAYVTIEQTASSPTTDAPPTCLPDGCPGFLAYGSVLDNLSGDATTLESVYDQALTAEAQAAIYGTSTSTGKPVYRRIVSRKH